MHVRSWLAAWSALSLFLGLEAHAQPQPPGSYPVSSFVLEYVLPHPEHPPLAELLKAEVELHRTPGGYEGPQVWDPTVRVRLDALPPTPGRFFPRGLTQASRGIIAELARYGIGGVIITVPEIEEGTGRDLRPGAQTPDAQTTLRLKIWTGRAADVTTLGEGDRFAALPAESRVDMPAHAWILEDSPVQPGGDRGLLRMDAIDAYAMRLSRHPSRRVDAELSPGHESGTAMLDYRVAENRPWYAYAQWSNTGTQDTTRSRPRFGFVHDQVTGRDDILRLDYVSGNFDEVHGFFGSYEAPLPFHSRRVRVAVYGDYTKYDASTVGLSFADFEGEQWDVSVDLIWQAFQWRELFVDLVVGERWTHAKVDNNLLGTDGKDDFFLPRFGVRVERDTLESSLRFATDVDFNVSSIAGTKRSQVELLGRANGVKDFTRLRWNGTLSVYLEALLDRAAWADPSTPGSSTLAHEAFLAFRGQYTFDKRVAPQFEMVAGGLYSVRGYEQSLVAGDTVVMGTVEYRLHLPRLFYPESEPREAPLVGRFRAAPQYVFGRPDWDLILRAFFDAAWVKDAERFSFEPDDALLGAGGGVELQLLRNFSVRYDVGVSLDSVGGLADKYDVEHYVVVTLLY